MTASLPDEVQAVFDRFITTELTTVNRAGQPITWPVTPYYSLGDPCIDVTTGLGYPKKANDARANPLVSLLFSDPTGSGLHDTPMVLIQGTADVDDRDLEANRKRYERESIEKLPGTASLQPPDPLKRMLAWYYTRIYIHVRPSACTCGRTETSRSSPPFTTPTWKRFAPATPRSPTASTPPRSAASAPGTIALTSSARSTEPQSCHSCRPTASRSRSAYP